MKNRITALLVALGVALGLTVAGPAGTAQAVQNSGLVGVHVRADLSQSNMLFSFQDQTGDPLHQTYVCEGCYYGEAGDVLISSEPQQMWTNPGWCSGYRYVIYDTRFDPEAVSTSAWWYVRGGYNGVSTHVNPRPNWVSDVPSYNIYEIQAYLVPVGVAGCTY
ncbi:hypothetical protein FHU33_0986 [Blastococcus colisei]|uniref:Peptidase inhibitor family I36 n=1 Tax=Blastococcus colisei TaxID=1564162 RepID=A0A543PC04_9ACTN|nr:DUF4148 domain-containing protein [Blastococcus colisei]TQN41615.1 hypothetical protein FHU33_0986 [Blastococcus colisei]